MIELLPWIRGFVVVAFALLAIVAVARLPRSGPAGRWVAAAFGALALALLVGMASDLGVTLPGWLDPILVVLILGFPYLLLRFTASFRDLSRWIEVAAGVAAVVVMGVAAVLPGLLAAGSFLAVVLAYWVSVSSVTVARLWKAGQGQPTVARRRMRLMSAATAVLAIAIVLAAQPLEIPAVELVVQLVALGSGITFGLGFAPPRALRLSWRRPEEQHLQRGMLAVLGATTVEDVGRELLEPTAEIVGAGGAALLNHDGEIFASHGTVPADVAAGDEPSAEEASRRTRQVVSLGEGRGDLVVWTSPYAPFFGREEIELLRSMGAVAALALERCDLIAHEREQRAAVEQARNDAEAARAEAERANMAKSEFLSRMSHELRTPLNAILGFGQLLETVELDDEDAEGVHQILKAGRHLLALIDDVLDLSRIEAGALAISLEPVHASELIADTVALVRPQVAERSIRLSTDPDGCDVYVMTDRQRCRQVLLNLLSNAVKYNYDGGEVDIRCVQTDGTLRITVRDTGPGIDPDRQAELFQPFERLGAESSPVEGTGLGLALTKQLTEHLGGRIGVESTLQQGSTFWIELPLTDAPMDRDDPVARHEVPAHTGDQTLLLVEDNLANLRVVEAMLRRRPGISVIPAMQGRLAVELATQHQPDVIVLDLHLPDLPGRDVLNRLKSDRRTRDIPVVIASAEARPTQIRRLRADGAFDYITKPIDLQKFLNVVDAALAERDATRSERSGTDESDTSS